MHGNSVGFPTSCQQVLALFGYTVWLLCLATECYVVAMKQLAINLTVIYRTYIHHYKQIINISIKLSTPSILLPIFVYDLNANLRDNTHINRGRTLTPCFKRIKICAHIMLCCINSIF